MFVMLPPVRTSSVHERQITTTTTTTTTTLTTETATTKPVSKTSTTETFVTTTTIKRRRIPITKDRLETLSNTAVAASTSAATVAVTATEAVSNVAATSLTYRYNELSSTISNYPLTITESLATLGQTATTVTSLSIEHLKNQNCCCYLHQHQYQNQQHQNHYHNQTQQQQQQQHIGNDTTIISTINPIENFHNPTTNNNSVSNNTNKSQQVGNSITANTNIDDTYTNNNNNNHSNGNVIRKNSSISSSISSNLNSNCILSNFGNCRKRFSLRKSLNLNKDKSYETKHNIRLSIENQNNLPILTNNIKRKLSLFQSKKTSATSTPPATRAKPNFILGELNNFRKPTNLQAPPVATILNDLSPVPGTTKVKNRKSIFHISPMTPKGLPSDTPDVKAMRYYRLWIYTCNAVLLMAVIIFCGVAGKVLVADYRRLLVTGLNLGQPNFIYAYLALIVQSGFLQLIGCLGALKLSEKLLNAYWLLLLVLLIGDAILGIFWMFKFDRIMQELQPILRYRLATEYGNSIEFSDLWDRLQSESRCCGVIGPQDFTTIAVNRSYPTSCCTSADVIEQITVSKRPLASPVVFRNDELTNAVVQQKNNLTDIADTAWSHVVSENREEEKTIPVCKAVFQQGCVDRIATWLRNTADILVVLGYCVIAFLKLCFLGILRYEIKEMIQKIKLLQNEMAAAILEPEIGEQQLTQQATSPSINGGVHTTEPKVGNRDRERSRMSSGESERESLLIHDHPLQQQQHQLQQHQQRQQQHLRNKHLYGCIEGGAHGGIGGGGVGIESDSNSNCALIVEDSGAAAVAAAKALNSNNNYELSEFETRGPTYRIKTIYYYLPWPFRKIFSLPTFYEEFL